MPPPPGIVTGYKSQEHAPEGDVFGHCLFPLHCLASRWAVLFLIFSLSWYTLSRRPKANTDWNSKIQETAGTFSLYNLAVSVICYNNVRLTNTRRDKNHQINISIDVGSSSGQFCVQKLGRLELSFPWLMFVGNNYSSGVPEICWSAVLRVTLCGRALHGGPNCLFQQRTPWAAMARSQEVHASEQSHGSCNLL